MDIDLITQYIMTIAPALVSILTVISTMVVSIKKIRSDSCATVSEVKMQSKINSELKEQLTALSAENAELKKEIKSCMNQMSQVAEVQHVNGK